MTTVIKSKEKVVGTVWKIWCRTQLQKYIGTCEVMFSTRKVEYTTCLMFKTLKCWKHWYVTDNKNGRCLVRFWKIVTNCVRFAFLASSRQLTGQQKSTTWISKRFSVFWHFQRLVIWGFPPKMRSVSSTETCCCCVTPAIVCTQSKTSGKLQNSLEPWWKSDKYVVVLIILWSSHVTNTGLS